MTDAAVPTLIARYSESRAIGKKYSIPRARSDTGNAERLLDAYEGELLFDTTRHTWRFWDGCRWALDATRVVRQCARSMVRAMPGEAQHVESEEERKALLRWAAQSDSTRRIDALLREAESLPGFAVTGDSFDRDPWLLNCRNGTVDLRTGELRSHDATDRITRQSPYDLDAAADCPTFRRAALEIMFDRKDLVDFLQRFLGYALTGVTREQVFCIFYGSGANGKSTLLNAVAPVFGDYGNVTSTETFVVRNRPSIPNDVAALARVRFLRCAESEQGAPLAEGLVKAVTGGEPVSARFLHGEFFQFTPEFKLVLSTNHRPRIRGTDRAIWRRVLLVPFDAVFGDERRDDSLAEKLTAEAPGILGWLVQGCLEWQRGGLRIPEAVRAATREYRAEEDRVGAFLDDRCTVGEGSLARAGELYRAYGAWCDEFGERAVSMRVFASALHERGLERVRTNAGALWRGVAVRSDSDG